MQMMKKFRMVARRPAPWHDRTAQAGETVLVIAAKTEAEARWFFGRLDWSAWEFEAIEDTVATQAQDGREVSHRPMGKRG